MAADPLAVIRQAQGSELVDEDGNEVVLDVLPPASLEEVDALEARLRVPLPTELRTVLAVTRGVEGAAVDWLELTGAGTRSFGMEDVFPAGLPIAGDGFGNFWVLDLTDQPTELAPVLYASHDPPVVLFQSPNLGAFLEELFKLSRPPHASLVNDVHEDRLFSVWRTHPGLLSHAEALAGDDTLRTFAEGLDERFVFADLRACEVGMGFAWSRGRHATECRRFGFERVFAISQPAASTGRLGRLFGKR